MIRHLEHSHAAMRRGHPADVAHIGLTIGPTDIVPIANLELDENIGIGLPS